MTFISAQELIQQKISTLFTIKGYMIIHIKPISGLNVSPSCAGKDNHIESSSSHLKKIKNLVPWLINLMDGQDNEFTWYSFMLLVL